MQCIMYIVYYNITIVDYKYVHYIVMYILIECIQYIQIWCKHTYVLYLPIFIREERVKWVSNFNTICYNSFKGSSQI